MSQTTQHEQTLPTWLGVGRIASSGFINPSNYRCIYLGPSFLVRFSYQWTIFYNQISLTRHHFCALISCAFFSAWAASLFCFSWTFHTPHPLKDHHKKWGAMFITGWWWLNPFEKIWVRQWHNGKDDMPCIMENNPVMFETTNQLIYCVAWKRPRLGPTFSKRTVLRIFLDVQWSNIGLTFR